MSESDDVKHSVYRGQFEIIQNLARLYPDERPAIYAGVMTALVQVLWADRVKDVIKSPEEFMAKLWGGVGRQCLDCVLANEMIERERAAVPEPTTDQVGRA